MKSSSYMKIKLNALERDDKGELLKNNMVNCAAEFGGQKDSNQ